MTGPVANTRGARSPSRVAVVGHLAQGRSGADGQILRTRIVVDELTRRLGADRVDVVDTGGGRLAAARILLGLLWARLNCSDVIVMPGSRGLRRLLPIYAHLARRAEIRVHYLVVGGWLPRYLRERPNDVANLRTCRGLYVQTRRMRDELRAMGLERVHLLPNFRRFPRERPRSGACQDPLRLVFLSRIIPEKGVGLAITAVERLNAELGRTAARLDIYGPVETPGRAWFDELVDATGSAVHYRGSLPPDAVQERLTHYDAMLFPSYYSGEAFPGVILDAMIAGIPVIASDWQDNAEFVEHGRNGLLCLARDVDALTDAVRWSVENPDEVMRMKNESATRADAYHVDEVIPQLLDRLGLASSPDAPESSP